jgi:ATP adenylyltransferase
VDRLWAPWRLAYVTATKDRAEPAKDRAEPAPAGDDCFICRGAAAPTTDDRANLVAYRTGLSVVLLNRFPYNNGHLLVCPRAHKGRFEDLSLDELVDLQLVLRRMLGVLQERMNPDGFNLGLNLGRVAGAGVPGHLHWHIVPRWNGDTNFMPVVGDTKVISQSLEALYDVVTEGLAAGRGEAGPPAPTAEHRP